MREASILSIRTVMEVHNTSRGHTETTPVVVVSDQLWTMPKKSVSDDIFKDLCLANGVPSSLKNSWTKYWPLPLAGCPGPGNALV